MEIRILSLGGMYPLQGFGRIECAESEYSFYFYAKEGTWKMAIAETLDQAVLNTVHKDGWYWEGQDCTEETLSVIEAKRIIVQCAQEYDKFTRLSRTRLKTEKALTILWKRLEQTNSDDSFFDVIAQVCRKLRRTKVVTPELQTDIRTLEHLSADGQD